MRGRELHLVTVEKVSVVYRTIFFIFVFSIFTYVDTTAAETPENTESEGDVLLDILQADSEKKPLNSGFSNAELTLAVIPRYPRGGLKRKIDGKVTLEFDIARHGRAINIKVVEEMPRAACSRTRPGTRSSIGHFHRHVWAPAAPRSRGADRRWFLNTTAIHRSNSCR